MEPQCISGITVTRPCTAPASTMERLQAKWSMCVPVSICFILLLVGGISMLTGYDHVRAANIVSFSGCMLVFFIFIFIVKKSCFEATSTVKTILDPAPAYQKKWRKEYYSNLQESCMTEIIPKDEEDELQVLHISQTVNSCHSKEPAMLNPKQSTLEFQNYGFKEVNDASNSLSQNHMPSADDTFDLPSYDQAMAN